MRVLVLGGYGNFGGLVSRELARDMDLELIVAGRNAAAAEAFAGKLGPHVRAARLDINAPDFARQLAALAPELVIHTGGPFQGRDYRVASATLDAGAHYIDLADARAFVAGIDVLDARAREANRLVVSGASTVPGLSAAVVDRYRIEFDALTDIDIGISPGNRAPRGVATVAAILSYVGRPLQMWKNGQWSNVFGWQGLRRERYPAPAGTRWLGNCDVPDLILFPPRYPGLKTLRFGAGLELGMLHLGLWLLSWPVRWHLLPRLDRWARGLKRISEWFLAWGSDAGAMHVRLRGAAVDGKPLTLTWILIAGSGDGPQVPATAAIVLARTLARGQLPACGARPCLDLFSLEEFLAALGDYDIRVQVQRERG
jgi:Saccharopine dehydrogenase NADP binding domain